MSRFERDVFTELNKFREYPQSIHKQIELLRKGLSRIKSTDPFLAEIDQFINQLESMKPQKKMTLNPILSKIAQNEAKKFSLDSNYNQYRTGNQLKGILPDSVLKMNIALIADFGADEAENQIPKLLLNKIDKKKMGRQFLTNPKFTQVGIGNEIFDEENYTVFIFADDNVKIDQSFLTGGKNVNETNKENKENLKSVKKTTINREYIEEEDSGFLKQAFDLLDKDGTQTININDAINAMKRMKFDETNPELFNLISSSSEDGDIVSWVQFSSYVNGGLKDRKSEEGLKTIFNLFIDNPENETITFDTFKKICKEIGENMSEEEMQHILENTTEHGNEITFKDFIQYMKINEE